jgi:hypothetical protein
MEISHLITTSVLSMMVVGGVLCVFALASTTYTIPEATPEDIT